MANGDSAIEAAFITAKGALQLRMVANDSSDLVETARSLKAPYFIAVDGYDHAEGTPIWGVFETKTANQVLPGTWSIRDPIRKFSTETSDAAVMWALAKIAGGGQQ